jgi:hypothetical protein
MLHLRTIVVMAVIGSALLMSATAYGATVASGTVVDANGNPLANVPVNLYDELMLGVDQNLNPVASTTTASDGTYSLDLSVTSTYVNRAGANGGAVNFDVIASNGAILAYAGIARWPHQPGTCPPNIPTCRPTVEEWLEDPSGEEESALAAAGGASSSLTLQASPVPGGEKTPASAAAATPCGIHKTAVGTQTAWAVVGQLHLGNDQSATFKYGQSADSDMGIGFSNNNANWSIKGESHIGNSRSASVTLPKSTGDNGMFGKRTKTQFKTVKYHFDGCVGVNFWKIIGEKWTAGSDWGGDYNDKNGHCADTLLGNSATFVSGGRFTRSSNNFSKYVDAISVFGVSLSNQSGASTFVTEHWTFGNHFNRYWLCGSDNDVNYAHRIYAGA